MKRIVWFILLMFLWAKGFSTHYFVSNGGNNTNNGTTQATPWQTLVRVNTQNFVAGDTVSFNGGQSFVGTLTIRTSGAVNNPIVYNSYGSGKATITAFVTVPSFVNLGANIWESTNPVSTRPTLNMVSINGANIAMGRTPNFPNYYNWQTRNANVSITSSNLNSAVINWTGAELAVFTQTYRVARHPITAQAGTVLTYNATGNADPSFGTPGTYFLAQFLIQNDVRTLDVQNEWYYSPTTRKIRIFSTAAPTNVQVATLDTLVWTNIARDNIVFKNLKFTGSNKNAIELGTSRNIKILSCDFNFIGYDGIYAPSWGQNLPGLRIDSCTFNNLNGCGVDVSRWFTLDTVRYNTVKNTGMLIGMNKIPTASSMGTGLFLQGANGLISNNTTDTTCLMGIRFFGSNTIVSNNFVQHFCAGNGVKDGGGVYTFNNGDSVITGSKVFNNIILFGTPFSQGVYLDDHAVGIEIYNNTISGCQRGVYLHNTRNINVHDNTSYNNDYAFLIGDEGRKATNIISKHNQWFARVATQFGVYYNPLRDSILPFFVSDSNYILRPIDDNLTFSFAWTLGATTTNQNLPQFVTQTGLEVHTTRSPLAITNVNQLDFQYNATPTAAPKTLPFNGLDAKSTAYSAGVITMQPFSSLVLIANGTQVTPIITWANPASITFGTPLSGTQLNATANTAGTFVYNPVAGTVLNAGTQTLSVTFTPSNPAAFTTAFKSVTITVLPASASLAYSNLTQTYTGSPLSPTVTTTPAGLTVVSTTYNGVGVTPTNAGVYSITSGLSNQNYSAPPISGTFTINKATATITISNLNQVYDGSPKPITVATTPAGLTGISVTYNGSATVPTNAGSYPIVATLTNANYTATNATGTLIIAKATPTVSWSNPAAITYGTVLSGTQLNASASVAGSFTYTPPSGTLLNAGTQSLSANFTPTDAANYNSVLNTTVSIVVNKATATISLSNLAQVYDGTGKSATATTSPAGLNTVTITYDGSPTLPINSGSYAVSATLNNSNYNASPATGTLVIDKAAATLDISNTAYTYDGTQKSVTVTTAPVGLNTVSVTYNGSPTAPSNAGSYPVIAHLSNANYTAEDAGATLVIDKATPIITWSNPSAITYGTALSGTQLNATSNVAGTFTYNPVSGTILNAGSNTLTVNFTPTDASNYNSVNGTNVTLVVNKATAVITLSNLAQDYDGNPKPVTVSVSPNVGVISVTYNGSPTAPSAVGSYTVIATLSNANYQATPANGTLVITMPPGNVAITNINQTYTGSPLPVTVTTSPGSYSTAVTYNGSGTVPTNAGTYTVIATINDGIHVGADTATYIIGKATPVITWSNPSAITFGTALSGTQLNASSSVAGTFTYTPPSGTILNAGTQTLSVNFVPSSTANYNSINGTTVTIVVNKAVATITTTNTSQAYDGSPKPVTVTTSPVGLATVTTTYNGSTTAPSAIGSYQVISTLVNSDYTATPDTVTLTIGTTPAGISISNINQVYTGSPLPVDVTTNPNGLSYTVTYNGSTTIPTNAGTYTVIATLDGGTYTGADTQTLVISKVTPVINWSNPSSIVYGTALSGTQLNATTSTVAGTFVYTPISGSVLNVGTQSLSVAFTPTDGTNYNSVNKIVPITVTAASATLTLSNTTQTYDGNPKPVTVTTSPTGISGVVILYNGSATVPTNAGTYTLAISLSNSNYTATPISGTLTINKSNDYTLTFTLPLALQQGSPITAAQLTATSTIAGTFTYNYPLGTIMNSVGTFILTATFTPSNANYNTQTISAPLSVFGTPLLDFWIKKGTDIYLNLPYP